MKELRIAKKYGKWYYEKEYEYGMRFYMYKLYDENEQYVNYFAYYNDMIYYIKTGIVI